MNIEEDKCLAATGQSNCNRDGQLCNLFERQFGSLEQLKLQINSLTEPFHISHRNSYMCAHLGMVGYSKKMRNP